MGTNRLKKSAIKLFLELSWLILLLISGMVVFLTNGLSTVYFKITLGIVIALIFVAALFVNIQLIINEVRIFYREYQQIKQGKLLNNYVRVFKDDEEK